MDRFAKLGSDIVTLWTQYGSSFLDGAKNTIILALIATAIGCVIGLSCGLLQTIPSAKTDSLVKRFFLKHDKKSFKRFDSCRYLRACVCVRILSYFILHSRLFELCVFDKSI